MHDAHAVTENTIGEIVADDYRTAAVFEKHGIDFCCGGQIALAVICQAKGVDPAAITREIEAVKRTPLDHNQNFTAWPLAFLADYIIHTHHAYLKDHTGQIAAYVQKIAEVHGAHHPEVVEIAAIFAKIATDLAAHLREEEAVCFPAIKRGEAARTAGAGVDASDRDTIQRSLATLRHEHEAIGEATHTIRRLAQGFAIPADVCNTFRVTYQELNAFEADLHKHVHLENNILFTKAAQL